MAAFTGASSYRFRSNRLLDLMACVIQQHLTRPEADGGQPLCYHAQGGFGDGADGLGLLAGLLKQGRSWC